MLKTNRFLILHMRKPLLNQMCQIKYWSNRIYYRNLMHVEIFRVVMSQTI